MSLNEKEINNFQMRRELNFFSIPTFLIIQLKGE